MKKLIAIACVLLSTVVMAEPTVSTVCNKNAYLNATEINQCINSGADLNRVVACTRARFFYSSDFQSCLTMEGKTEKVDRCSKAGFLYIEDFRNCIK